MLIILLAGNVFGIELNGALTTGLEYSDNVARSSSYSTEDFIHNVSLEATIEESSRAIQTSADFRAEHIRYLNGTFEDQTSVTSGFGLVNLGFIESFLDWRSSFTRTQILNDSAAADIPDNREHRDLIETGPVVRYSYSDRLSSSLSAFYTVVENSNEDISDSERVNSELSFQYQYNPITLVSLSGNYERVIDGDELEEYDHLRVNFGLTRQFARGRYSLEVGRGKISPDAGEETDYSLLELGVQHNDILWHVLNVTYSQNTTDSSIGFSDSAENGALEETQVRGVSRNDIVSRRRLSADFRRDIVSVQYVLGAGWETETFERANLDERTRDIDLRLDYDLSQRLDLFAVYRFSETDFGRRNIGVDRLSEYQAGISDVMTDSLSVRYEIGFSHRRNAVRSEREFEELSSSISVNWTVF